MSRKPTTDAEAIALAKQANEAALVFARWARGLSMPRGEARLAMLMALVCDCDRQDDVLTERAAFAGPARLILDNMEHVVVAMAFSDVVGVDAAGALVVPSAVESAS